MVVGPLSLYGGLFINFKCESLATHCRSGNLDPTTGKPRQVGACSHANRLPVACPQLVCNKIFR